MLAITNPIFLQPTGSRNHTLEGHA
jgi:hypothetical protein